MLVHTHKRQCDSFSVLFFGNIATLFSRRLRRFSFVVALLSFSSLFNVTITIKNNIFHIIPALHGATSRFSVEKGKIFLLHFLALNQKTIFRSLFSLVLCEIA